MVCRWEKIKDFKNTQSSLSSAVLLSDLEMEGPDLVFAQITVKPKLLAIARPALVTYQS